MGYVSPPFWYFRKSLTIEQLPKTLCAFFLIQYKTISWGTSYYKFIKKILFVLKGQHIAYSFQMADKKQDCRAF